MLTTAAVEGFTPLAPLLQAISPERLATGHRKIAGFATDDLINKFRTSFHAGKREVSSLYADGLVSRGLPPTFWHEPGQEHIYTVQQRLDLFTYDVRWLRFAHRHHAGEVKYQRGRLLLAGTDAMFWRESTYAFWGGRRPAWKLVSSLNLTEQQQTDCHWLRSAPTQRRLRAAFTNQNKVFKALADNMDTVRRISTFTDDHAKALLLRQRQIWLCAQLAAGKPTETARRYSQLTGIVISRALAANHLQKIESVLRKREREGARE